MSLPDVSRLAAMPGTALRDRLLELGLTARYLRENSASSDDLRSPLEPVRRAALSDEADAVAFRLLFCDQSVPETSACDALCGALLDALLACGVLVRNGSAVRAPFHLRPVAHLYLLSDYLGTAEPDAVMGAGETTAILHRATLSPEDPPATVLDLGCGAGALALLHARDAAEVIGSDINSRAVTLAAANATLNGLSNVTFLLGDTYEPVAGQTFDLILSQPPYYPAGVRGAGLTFLHGGAVGDEIACRILEGASPHLTPAGRAVIFTSWPENRSCGAPPRTRVLELYTTRRELAGTRQSMTVVEHARASGEWSAGLHVAADSWGFVGTDRIGELLAGFELLHAPGAMFAAAKLHLHHGISITNEGNVPLLRGTPESLAGTVPVSPEQSAALRRFTRPCFVAECGCPPALVRELLSRGWLTLAG